MEHDIEPEFMQWNIGIRVFQIFLSSKKANNVLVVFIIGVPL